MERQFFYILLLFGIFNSITLSGQEKSTFNPITDDISQYIPPLSVLMDSAIIMDPKIDFRDLQIEINERKSKSARRQWSKNFGLVADFRYGTFDNYSLNDAGALNPSYTYAKREELKFGYGAYLKFPLNDFYDRKNQIMIAQAETSQAESMLKLERNEKRQIILKQYNDLVLSQKILKIKAKSYETAKINLQMAEKEFLDGIIPVSEFARLSDIVSRSEIDFETIRMDFLTNYMMLEEITGIKLRTIKEIQATNENN